MFTSPAKREIRRFHIVVVQRRQRNVQKSVLQVQSSCFANLIQLLFLPFSLPSSSSSRLLNLRASGGGGGGGDDDDDDDDD